MLDTILATLRGEFSDLGNVEQITRTLVRLLLAGALGGVLGYEREIHSKVAGIRTHMLVAMGACLFVLVPQLNGVQIGDMSRVIQGVIAGIGFLCAGAIVKSDVGHGVHGLTTSAGFWMTAAIGMACGLGRESTALISTILALVVLAVVPKHVERARTGKPSARNGDASTPEAT